MPQYTHSKIKSKIKSNIHKNNKTRNKQKIKKSHIELKNYEDQLKKLTEVIDSATTTEQDLEIYTINHRIIHLLLLQLVIKGTQQSIKLANKYSDKTGIKVDIGKFRRYIASKVPTIRNTVTKIKKTSKNPTPGSMAPGWVPGY
jgi:hypothetical protein